MSVILMYLACLFVVQMDLCVIVYKVSCVGIFGVFCPHLSLATCTCLGVSVSGWVGL